MLVMVRLSTTKIVEFLESYTFYVIGAPCWIHPICRGYADTMRESSSRFSAAPALPYAASTRPASTSQPLQASRIGLGAGFSPFE